MIPFTAAHQVQESSPPAPGWAAALVLVAWLVVLGVALWALWSTRRRR